MAASIVSSTSFTKQLRPISPVSRSIVRSATEFFMSSSLRVLPENFGRHVESPQGDHADEQTEPVVGGSGKEGSLPLSVHDSCMEIINEFHSGTRSKLDCRAHTILPRDPDKGIFISAFDSDYHMLNAAERLWVGRSETLPTHPDKWDRSYFRHKWLHWSLFFLEYKVWCNS